MSCYSDGLKLCELNFCSLFGTVKIAIERELTDLSQILSETDFCFQFGNDRLRNVWNVSLLIECLKQYSKPFVFRAFFDQLIRCFVLIGQII